MFRRPVFFAGLCAVLAALLLLPYTRAARCGRVPEGAIHRDQEEVLLAGRVVRETLVPDGVRILLGEVADLTEEPRAAGIVDAKAGRETDLAAVIRSWKVSDATYTVSFYLDETETEPGDLLLVKGVGRSFFAASNPGQFDDALWQRENGTAYALRDAVILRREPSGNPVGHVLHRMRRELFRNYRILFGERHAGLLSAITLGDRALMDRSYQQLYQEGGLAHLLSVSGLHISLIGMSLFSLLRRRKLPRWICAAVSAAVLFGYLETIGWSISSKRAAIMFLIWLGAQAAGRGYDSLTAMGTAALLMLFSWPSVCGWPAFWLSFSAVASLGILAPGMMQGCLPSTKAGRAFLTMVSLQAGMLPVLMMTQYQVSPWGFLTNLLVLPVLSVLLFFAVTGGLVCLLCPGLAVFLSAPCHYLLSLSDAVCTAEQKLPFSVLVCGKPDPVRMGAYYACLFLLYLLTTRLKRRRICLCLWIAGIVAAAMLLAPGPVRHAEITCLDVGQGDGILVQTQRHSVCMIDGGSSTVSALWSRRLEPALKSKGVRTIEWWFITHTDDDHISALREFLEEYSLNAAGENCHGITLKRLVLPAYMEDEETERLAKTAGEKGAVVYRMQAGGRVHLPPGTRKYGLSFLCLSPDRERLIGDKNQDCLVLMLKYGKFRMLLTGDLGEDGERMLAESGEDLRADILKVGHHGSRFSSSEAFLERVCPGQGIISCALHNRYGHPAPETLRRLEQAGCSVFLTMEGGAVCVTTDGEHYRTEPFISAGEPSVDF